MNGCRRGAGRARGAERRRRAAHCPIHLEARNALIARLGLLGLLAQDHGVVAAADRTRRRLEAERGALREGEPWCSGENRRDQAYRGDTSLQGHTSAPPMRPQRTIALIVPSANLFSGGKARRGRPVHVADDCGGDDATGSPPILSLSSQRLNLAARSFAPT